MPRRCPVDRRLPLIIDAQDGLLHAGQALAAGMSRRSLLHKVSMGYWQRLLPDVFLTVSGTPTRRQLLVAALQWAGPEAVIDGIDACAFYGLSVPGLDREVVHIVVPDRHPARSTGFVRVRRSVSPIAATRTEFSRYVDPATAVVVAARSLRRSSSITALFSDALRCRLLTLDELVAAHETGPPRGLRAAEPALEAVAGGARSAPEADVRQLILSSRVFPEVLFNQPLRLPEGRIVVPDALICDSAVVHEVNGRRFHEREDLFESMQERHDVMTSTGLTLLHNSPSRIRAVPSLVLDQLEQTHRRYAGRGMPDGVVLIERGITTF